ncbi:MAG TPA: TlpA disulfide reductase family protein [Thermodesulfobacteriota bacterium]|nr:TlpA disulfide reductase family protein [Thermodesulfobacteriota bacterium]
MKRRFLFVAPAIFLILTLLSCEQGNGEPGSGSDQNSAVDFSLETVDGGKKISLRDFNGKPVVLNFWATWCGPCKEELPLFEKMWNKFKDDDVVFLGVDVMDDRTNALEFIKNSGITYTNLYDQPGEVSSKYKVVALPVTFFIDKEGEIAIKNYGPFIGKDGEKKFKLYMEEIAE